MSIQERAKSGVINITMSSSSLQVQDLDNHKEQLASVIRVRNRLAVAPDSKLSHVLTGLLPRLCRQLDKNSLALYCVSSETEGTATETQLRLLRQQIQQHLLGILAHCSERIRGNISLRNAAWIEAVVSDLNSWESSVTLTAALSLLETAISSLNHNNEDECEHKHDKYAASNLVPHLISFLDRHHHSQDENLSPTTSSSQRMHLRMASWLLLDAVALSSGMHVHADWVMMDDAESAVPWDRLEVAPFPNEAAVQAITKDGAGVFHLLLDVLLFWPATETTNATATGLSSEGLAKMNHKRKGASWNELYLLQLKYVCVRYALGTPTHPGLFCSGNNRAVLLAVLASGNSMHGRLALAYLNQMHCNGTQSPIARQLNKTNFKCEAPTTVSCSLTLAVSLLILMLGDADATPLLSRYRQYEKLALCNESILGPLPTAATLLRTALPIGSASLAAQFVLDHFHPNVNPTDDDWVGLRLYLDLIVVLQDQRGAYWGIQLMQNLYNELRKALADHENDEWVNDFYQRCLQTAKTVLVALPEAATREMGDGATTGLLQPAQGVPAGLPEPFERRRDLNMLLRDHRVRQKRKRVQSSGAIKARQVAYQIITELATERYLVESCEDKLSFDIPIVILQCASVEDETMQSYLSQAMDALLSAYKQLAATRRGSVFGTKTQHQVAPLLPSLVSAACSDSAAARLVVARWTSDFLLDLDPSASLHICMHLASDYDPFVSSLAKKAIPKLKMLAGDVVMEARFVALLDQDDGKDVAFLSRDLDMQIELIAAEGRLEKTVAAVILYDFGFSTDEAAEALREDRAAVLGRSGLLCYNDMDIMWADNRTALETCGICYNEGVDGYSMPCGHSFCEACWRSYLIAWFNQRQSSIMKITCPQHDCCMRLTSTDIQFIHSELSTNWQDSYLSSFVEKSTHYRRCTGPDCRMVAFLRDPPDQMCRPVTCGSCDSSFCFTCGEAPHEPARCDAFQEWNLIFSTNSFWVKKHSKPCPSCKAPIEKTDGCNHMACTQCGADFCWLCLSLLQMHLQAHTCNRYDPVVGAEDDEEKRALFLTDRFQAHEEAEIYAKEKLKVLLDDDQDTADKRWFISEEAFELLVEAWRVLVRGRQFLKWSYVAAWALRHDATELDVFSMSQATLELVTERLNQMTLENTEVIYQEQGERGVRNHFRAMAFLSSTVGRYQLRILFLDEAASK